MGLDVSAVLAILVLLLALIVPVYLLLRTQKEAAGKEVRESAECDTSTPVHNPPRRIFFCLAFSHPHTGRQECGRAGAARRG